MGFAVSITRFTQYVQVIVEGPTSIKNFVDMVDHISQDTVFWADKKVLVDLRGVVGELPAADQVFLGEFVAQNLQHLDKLASVVPPERITYNSEAAAQDLGMRLCVFTERAQALRWLTADPAPLSPAPTSEAARPASRI